MTAPPKEAWKSQTIWLNAAAIVVLLWAWRRGKVSADGAMIGALALAVANIGQRFRTTQPITITGPIEQIGGVQFDSAATIGAVVGDDANITEQAPKGD